MTDPWEDLRNRRKLTRGEIEAMIQSTVPKPNEQETAEAIAHKRESMRKMDELFAPEFFSPIEEVMISRHLARQLGYVEQPENWE